MPPKIPLCHYTPSRIFCLIGSFQSDPWDDGQAMIIHLRSGLKRIEAPGRFEKVTLIDADSSRMTERQLMLSYPHPLNLPPSLKPPHEKGGLVLRASDAVGLLLTPGSRGCCGESGSLSQCIRHDRHALRGIAE